MNTNSIRLFAKNARINLCKAVEHRIKYWGFDDDGHPQTQPVAVSGGYSFRGEVYNDTMVVGLWQNLKNRLSTGENTLQDTIEEAAYTWFNRLVAIKILEENNFIPPVLRFREGSLVPEILQKAKAGEHSITHSGKIESLQKALGDNDDEKALAILITDFCNKNPLLSEVFGKLDDYTQILLPQNLLAVDGFLAMLNDEKNIRPEDYREVELIGWLYQFYISDRKDEVFDGFKKNKKARPEDIPAATQIFTPKWIVSYMVENTLGKAYIDYEPDTPLKEQMKYLVEDQNTDHQPLIEDITELSLIDPAAGSGHILVVGFEWLYQMYIEQGYAPKNAAKAIIEHNLFGLDIDERAAQLARFAVLLKAALLLEKRMIGDGRSFLAEKSVLLPHIYAFPEVYHFSMEEVGLFTQGRYTEEITAAIRLLQKGKNIGSALRLSLSAEAQVHIKQQMTHWDSTPLNIEQEVVYKHLRPYLAVALTLAQRYTAVVANPPYMGSTNMNAELKAYLEKNYPMTKADLFAVFMEKMMEMVQDNARMGCITMESWMFLSSYEKMRHYILDKYSVVSLGHFGWHIIGIAFGTAMLVLEKSKNIKLGEYSYLTINDINRDINEPFVFPKKDNGRYAYIPQDQFDKIPGSPIAYWVSDKIRDIFEKCSKLENFFEIKEGIKTADNERFVREWWTINNKDIYYLGTNLDEKKYIFTTKGGDYRKWYGNLNDLLFWENNGYDLKKFKKATITNEENFFKNNITWNRLTTAKISFRYTENGSVPNMAGLCMYKKNIKEEYSYFLSFFNTKIVKYILDLLNPTLNFPPGLIKIIPFKEIDFGLKKNINNYGSMNISISKEEWDSRETSWDFERLSLIDGKDLRTAFENYCSHWRDNFVQLHKNEEELNRLFIEIYELQDEMDEKVEFEDITILKEEAIIIQIDNNISKEFLTESEKYLYDRGVSLEFNKNVLIKQFISYAVGCMFGRYSLDEEGLVFAGGEFDKNKYSKFIPDEDNCIPITDSEYFSDDIVTRFVEFVKTVYGEETLEENLKFIAQALSNKNDAPKDIIREYFLKSFYDDHLKRYKKRPIYWLYDAGKKNGFKALIYMHRYNEQTTAKVRIGYLHELQKHYERRASFLKDEIESNNNRKKAEQELKKIKSQLDECKQFDEKMNHLSSEYISIDLDDGVKVNYEKVQTGRDGKKYEIFGKVK